ncbi:hypothetical protein AKJ54_00695 [candidate division MSBL1 archaeon SCGC-AAA382K21]|uniref:Uncharacterized protein n=1 Tax=candidate division MSBL1 archaeon SCGC-AAA382K21 TaxID=1698283 RepID=A0A133VL43_9EURY|nr:hypothetical protein AKJ54_00695 [candidate division MSBL1 archaeon SCGC-AAA382K21]
MVDRKKIEKVSSHIFYLIAAISFFVVVVASQNYKVMFIGFLYIIGFVLVKVCMDISAAMIEKEHGKKSK